MEDFNGLVFYHTVYMRRLWDLVRDVQLQLVLHWIVGHGGLVVLNTPLPLPPSDANAATVERHTSPSSDSSSVTVPVLFSGGDTEVLVTSDSEGC